MREVDIETFATARADGAVVIDVREPFEYAAGHVPGAQLLPLNQVPAYAGDVPRNQPVYVICASGNRSLVAADYLAGMGVDAWSVAGGTGGWQRSGRPLVQAAGAGSA